MKSFVLLKLYLLIWTLYFSTVALLPATYSGGSYYLSYSMLVGSVIISLISFISLNVLFENYFQGAARQFISGLNPPQYLNTTMRYAILFSMISVVFLAYDRIFIQGIDYSKGLAKAREAWRINGENRSGVSSSFSVIGNLLSGFPLVLSSLLYYYYDNLSRWLRLISLIVGTVTVASSALLTGGRSIVMIFLLSLLLIGILRKARGLGFVPKKINIFVRVFSLFALVSSLIYIVYVFHLRAKASDDGTSLVYMLSILDHLGGEYIGVQNNDTYFIDDIFNYLTITGAYLSHSVWTLQSILNMDNHEGYITFNFYRTNIGKILDVSPEAGWAIPGRFPSYVGAFYYDYGILGAFLGSLAIGVLIFISTLLLYCKNLNLLYIGIYLTSMYIVALSPLGFAADFLSFPFVVFDFCLLYILSIFSRIRFTSMKRGDV